MGVGPYFPTSVTYRSMVCGHSSLSRAFICLPVFSCLFNSAFRVLGSPGPRFSWEGALQRAGAVGTLFNSRPRPVSLALSRRKLVSSGQDRRQNGSSSSTRSPPQAPRRSFLPARAGQPLNSSLPTEQTQRCGGSMGCPRNALEASFGTPRAPDFRSQPQLVCWPGGPPSGY